MDAQQQSNADAGAAVRSEEQPGGQSKQYQVVAEHGVKQLGIVPTALPPNPLILRHVEPGSWAAQNGISVGDELISVNGVVVTNINLKELDNFLRRERPLRLVFICKKESEIEPMSKDEFRELKRASTGEIDEFVEKVDNQSKPREVVSLDGPNEGQDPPPAVVGTWIYSGAYEYTISRSEDGRHNFEENRADEESGVVQGVTGVLFYRHGWLVGEIFDSEKRQRGWIRLQYVEKTDTVLSNVRLPHEDDWSDEKVAYRKAGPAQAEKMAVPEVQAASPAQPQILDGGSIWPEHWGITRAQCRDLLRRLQNDPAWDPNNTVYTLVSDFVVPWTRGGGLGYALMKNQDEPKEANLMVSHSWGENAEEFLTTLSRSTSSRDVLWVCALSMYHAEDGAGPSVAEQMGCTPEESPSHRVLSHIHARGLEAGCRWRWRSCLHHFPVLFVLLALLLFYTPIVIWGCVPSIDGSKCLMRRITEVNGKAQATWIWSSEYEDWVQAVGSSSGFANEVLPKAPYPATAACLLLAIILWICLWRSKAYNGRLLAVPGTGGYLYGRLWCVHEVCTASSLGVPVVLANTLAWVGRCKSRAASCSQGADQDRIWKIMNWSGEDGYEDVDRVLRRLLRRQRWKVLMALLGWSIPLMVFRWADQRLLSVSAGSLVGVSGLEMYFTGAIGVLAGVLCCCLVMYTTARLEKGTPACAAIVGAAFLLVGSAVVITAALLYFEDLRHAPPDNWTHGLDYFFDECFGHLRLGAPSSTGCSRLSRFWGAFTQTLLLGGIFLVVFLMGALCCPPCMKGCLQATVFALVAAAALLSTSVYSETRPPEKEHIFSFIVFYLTALFSRSLAPIFAMWAGVSKWGITLYSRRRRRPSSRSPESGATCPADQEERVTM